MSATQAHAKASYWSCTANVRNWTLGHVIFKGFLPLILFSFVVIINNLYIQLLSLPGQTFHCCHLPSLPLPSHASIPPPSCFHPVWKIVSANSANLSKFHSISAGLHLDWAKWVRSPANLTEKKSNIYLLYHNSCTPWVIYITTDFKN